MQQNFQIFGLTLPSYGVLVMLGAFVGVLIVMLFPYKKGVSKEHIAYAAIFAAMGIGFGAKLLYIIQIIPILVKNRELIQWDRGLIQILLSGGFVFYGGLVGGIVMILVYGKAFGLKRWALLETLIVSAPLIHAFGRLGCTAAGCCYGTPYNGPFALSYPKGGFEPYGVPLFPIQPLEALLNFIMFIVLFIYSRKERQEGRVLGIYITLYSIMRFCLEFLRGDIERGGIGFLSTSQIISLILLPIGLYLFFRKGKSTANANSNFA